MRIAVNIQLYITMRIAINIQLYITMRIAINIQLYISMQIAMEITFFEAKYRREGPCSLTPIYLQYSLPRTTLAA